MAVMKARDIAAVVAVGVGFYFLHSYLVGYAAAIAAPDWLIPFMRENQITGLAVLVAILVATLAVDYGHGFFGNLRINAFPSHGYDLPMFLAIGFFLPLATLLFGRRIRQD